MSLNNCQEDSLDVMTGMIQVFDLTLYAFLDSGANLPFVTPHVSMNFDIIPEHLVNHSVFLNLLVSPL